MKRKTNITVTKTGLIEETTGRKIESPLDRDDYKYIDTIYGGRYKRLEDAPVYTNPMLNNRLVEIDEIYRYNISLRGRLRNFFSVFFH